MYYQAARSIQYLAEVVLSCFMSLLSGKKCERSQPGRFSSSSHQKPDHDPDPQTRSHSSYHSSARDCSYPPFLKPNFPNPADTHGLLSCQWHYLCQPRRPRRAGLECPPSITSYRPRRNGGIEYGICRYPWTQSRRADARGVDLAVCISGVSRFSGFLRQV